MLKVMFIVVSKLLKWPVVFHLLFKVWSSNATLTETLPWLFLGETLQSLTADLDIRSYREPLGVTAGVAPFNFPAMIPLWMYPVSLMCGNTFILKPSERVPGAGHMLVTLVGNKCMTIIIKIVSTNSIQVSHLRTNTFTLIHFSPIGKARSQPTRTR